jgi:CubicO group peptidase (beta-lactamase class C family)
MRSIAPPLLALLAALSLASVARAGSASFGPPPGAELSAAKLAAIDGFVEGEIAAGHIPGAIVLVQQHGHAVYRKCFGKRDIDAGTPMTEDAIFPIHSVTKTITSVAAMMLVDRGTIALGDPVAKYIPSFAAMKVGVERKDESGGVRTMALPLSCSAPRWRSPSRRSSCVSRKPPCACSMH